MVNSPGKRHRIKSCNTFCFLPTFWSCYIWSAVTDIFHEVYKRLEVNTYICFDMVLKSTNAHKHLRVFWCDFHIFKSILHYVINIVCLHHGTGPFQLHATIYNFVYQCINNILHTHFFCFRMVTYYIIATQNLSQKLYLYCIF